MTRDNIHNKSNCLNNSLKSKIKITLNMHLGVLSGNIIESEPVICLESSLDFSCKENSQYISII